MLEILIIIIISIIIVSLLAGVAYCITPLVYPDDFNYILGTKVKEYIHIDRSQSTKDEVVVICDMDFETVKIPVSPVWFIRPLRRFCKQPDYPEHEIMFENDMCKRIWYEAHENK